MTEKVVYTASSAVTAILFGTCDVHARRLEEQFGVTLSNHSAEDEKDLTKVNFDIDLYARYTRGFLTGAQGIFTETELEYLPWGAKLMTLECGIRFLTDYLDGDNYFRIHYADQNLDRCRTQFKLVADMEKAWDEMYAIIEKNK